MLRILPCVSVSFRNRTDRIAGLCITVALLGIAIQLYRLFIELSQFRAFAATVVSLSLEALPFLILGSVAAAAVRVFAPGDLLRRLARRMGPAGIPIAALTGLVAPVCECAIVPTVAGLRDRGLSLPYAVTVLTAVPLLNPIVLASTIAAFPGRPELVAARFGGGFAVAVLTGLVFWAVEAVRRDDTTGVSVDPIETPGGAPLARRITALVGDALDEFLEVTRYFMVGVLLSSLVQVMVPVELFATLGSSPLLAGLAMIALAFILSVCSEADAFVAKAFLPLLPASSVIAFLVFGPMLDLKNAAMLHRVMAGRHILTLAAALTTFVIALVFVLEGLWA
ncbi:MAG: permease [Spirochaetales bacterium]|nr:permease [Spirochaetales bacterium]